MRRVSSILAALVVALLLALCLHPLTGWVVRLQLSMVCGGAAELSRVNRPSGEGDHLLSPAAQCAVLLCAATQKSIHTARPVEEGLWAGKPIKAETKPTQEALDTFEAEAARGEQLDPGNAFFPAMRAIGLLAQHRDADAIAALHRAGQKPRFDDYGRARTEAQLAATEAAVGRTGVLSHSAIVFASLFPHYAKLRSLTRVMAVLATQKETQGKAEEGLAIRRDLLALGTGMCRDATTTIGNLVGSALIGNANARPGTSEQVASRQIALDGFDEAQAVAEQVRSLSKRGRESGKTLMNPLRLLATTATWSGSLAALWAALASVFLVAILPLLVWLRRQHTALRITLGFLLVLVVLALLTLGPRRILEEWQLALQLTQGLETGPPMADATLAQSRLIFGYGMLTLALLLLPGFALMLTGLGSLIRKVPLSTSFARTGLVLALLMMMAYAALVSICAQREARLEGELKELITHEGRYNARLLGETWPEVKKKK